MSLSLALGILVSDLRGYRLLTRAHAQEAAPCAGQGIEGGVGGGAVNIEDGLILSGLTVRNVAVNGSVLEEAVIAGSVQITNATVVSSGSVIYAEGDIDAGPSGVVIGSGDRPCYNGVLIGSGDRPSPSGVLIGSGDRPSPSGDINVSGVTGTATGTAVGGTLTGDDIVITDGFITGQNLMLSGTTIDQGSISGTITSISIAPSN